MTASAQVSGFVTAVVGGALIALSRRRAGFAWRLLNRFGWVLIAGGLMFALVPGHVAVVSSS